MVHRRQSLHQGGDGSNQHTLMGPRQTGQGFEALGNDFRQRRKNVIGQGFPVGKMEHGNGFIQEKTDFLLQLLGAMAIGCDHHKQPGILLNRPGDCQGTSGAVQAAPTENGLRFAGGRR